MIVYSSNIINSFDFCHNFSEIQMSGTSIKKRLRKVFFIIDQKKDIKRIKMLLLTIITGIDRFRMKKDENMLF